MREIHERGDRDEAGAELDRVLTLYERSPHAYVWLGALALAS